MKRLINNKSLLVVILFVALVLRFWHLGANPPSLTWDEAAWGYNAYSLGLTGHDEFGRFLPLDYLESFGDFKPPVYAYLAVIPVKIFGLNEFATRFPSVFFVVLTVLLTYFLVKEIFKNSLNARSLALVAATLLAISPWHIMLSRAAFEANVATFFIITGVTFFIAGVKKRGWLLPFSALSFALGIQTFNTARVVIPILLIALIVGLRKELLMRVKWLVLAAFVGIVVLLPAVPFLVTPQARLRFKEVNIFSDTSIVKLANQEIANDEAWLAPLPRFIRGFTGWSKIIHNRRWGYLRLYLQHYFDNLNPAFLFIKGDGNPKFSTQDVGELYLWETPFLILGILLLFRRKSGFWWLVPFWLLVGILPAATARETPHALRIGTTLPTWQILTAVGVVEFWNWSQRQRRLTSGLWVVGLVLPIISLVYFQHGYWKHYPYEFAQEWQYGYKQAINYVKEVEQNYDEVWFTDKLGRPYIFFLYYLKTEPRFFQNNSSIKRDVFGFVNVKSFGKYHFWGAGDGLETKGRALIIDTPERIGKNLSVIKNFNLPGGKEALVAYEK